jgi:hypothetical protein
MLRLLIAIVAAVEGMDGSAATSGAPRPGPGSVRLVIERGAGAETCPGEAELRASVVRRLGFDPFDSAAAREIRCTLRREEGASFHARIDVAAGAGTFPAGRDLVSRRNDCGELAEAIELAVSIAINPLGTARPPQLTPASAAVEPPPVAVAIVPPPIPAGPPPGPPPFAVPAGARPPAAPALSTPPSTAMRASVKPPSRAYEIGVGADVAGTIGLGPGAAPGIGIGGSLRRHALSIDVGARVVDQSSASVAGGSVTAWLWTASAGPCFHRGVLAACAVGTAGAVNAHANGFTVTREATAPYLAVGARAVVEIPVSARLRARWTGEAAVPLVAVHFTIDGSDAWTGPRLNALTSLGLVAIFH